MFFNRIALFLLLCLTLLIPTKNSKAAPSAAGEKQPAAKELSMPNTPQPSDISLTYLPNGLVVAVKKDTRFPLASLRLYVHAGSAYETPDIAGISHQLEHMVFKGTEKRPKGAIATDIESAGGYLNAATSFDYTVYLTDMPSESWKLGMDVLKDMAFNPSLDPEELESEKDVVLAELQRGEDSPSGRLFKRVQASVLKGTPYERPIIGYPETIREYSTEKIRAYIDRLYQPRSMLLLVVGDVDQDAVLKEARTLFGDIPNTMEVTPPKAMRPEDFPLDGPKITLERTPWNKVYLNVAFPGVAMHDARAPALDIFSHLLGGDTSSYLYQTYKYEKRLVDSISASSYNFERIGLLNISVTLDPDKLGVFWEAFSKDLATLADKKYSDQEMDRAKLALTDSFYRQKETVAGIASNLGYFLFLGGGETGETTYLQQIDLVDHDAVSKAASDILKPERLNFTVLAPEQELSTTKDQGKTPPRDPDEAWLSKTLSAAWPASAAKTVDDTTADTGPAREVIELGKGRTLILQPDASMPYAAVDLVFAGGDSLLGPNQQGLASLAASVLTRGNKNMDAVKLEAFKNDRASSLAAGSGLQFFKISMDYPARFASDMWNLLHETLTSATLPEKEVVRAKENQTAAIVSREDQPIGLAFRRIFPFLFGTHLYGYQSQGSKDSVASFTRKDVTDFWNKQAKHPWVLSICGSFDREAVIAAAKKLPRPTETAPEIADPSWTKDDDLTIQLSGRNQAHLFLAFPGLGAGSMDEPGLDLLQNILAGQSGLLFRDLRDKQGLGYTVTAFQWQALKAGTLLFYIGTEPDKVAMAHKGFAKVIEELHATPLPEEELIRGKNQMRGDYIRSRQKMSSRSSEAAELAIMGRSLDAEKDVVDAALKLTSKDLQTLAKKYIDPDKAYVIKVVP